MTELYVNDTAYGQSHFDQRYADFARLPELRGSRGRRLAVCLPDPAEWIALCLYLRDRGASIAPIHPSTPLEAARRLATRLGCHALLFGRVESAEAVVDREPDAEAALVQLSSGTTGEPKAITRTWASVDREVESYVGQFAEAATMTPLVACPVTHSYGLICGVLAALRRGAVPVIVTSVNPKYTIRRALACERSLLYGSPTLLNVIVRLLAEGDTLHAVMTSGAPLRKACFDELQRRSRYVFQQYGCSEVGCVTLNTDAREANELGVPLGHLRVTAGTRPEAAQEICVHVDQRVVATRDLGYFGERGLCFVSRLDDTINVAGVNVYPDEVEEIILGFAGIEEAIVYKRADPYAGERVCLQFTACEEVDTGALRQWCATRLSPFQVPLELRQVDAIARLPNGKLNRRSLAEAQAASVAPELLRGPSALDERQSR